jgi:hypothetical protein
MQALAGAAIATVIGASLLVALRLLALHRRTRGWPELQLGGMLLLVSGLGYPLRIAATRASAEWVRALVIGSDVSIAIGFSLLFVFVWRVFRPGATWAGVFAAAGSLTMLGDALCSAVRIQHQTAVEPLSESPGGILLQAGPILVVSLWAAWESLRYYGMMRRRVSLGLADVTDSNRFLVWGLMGLFQTLGVGVNIWAAALKMDLFHDPRILLASSAGSLAQATLLVLAFVPPRSYLSWVRTRAAMAGA